MQRHVDALSLEHRLDNSWNPLDTMCTSQPSSRPRETNSANPGLTIAWSSTQATTFSSGAVTGANSRVITSRSGSRPSSRPSSTSWYTVGSPNVFAASSSVSVAVTVPSKSRTIDLLIGTLSSRSRHPCVRISSLR